MFRAGERLPVTLQGWTHVIRHVPKPRERTALRAAPQVNRSPGDSGGLRFVGVGLSVVTHGPLCRGADRAEAVLVGQGYMGNLRTFHSALREPKAALKKKINFFRNRDVVTGS